MRKLMSVLRGLRKEAISFVLDNNIDPLPIREGVRGYSTWKLRHDLKSGINVALLAFPQGMAYALIAGLPIHYGITCSAVAAIIAPFFSSSKFTILGPTNATALMVFSYFAIYPADNKLELMPLLVFMVGVLLVLGAYFRLAELIQYVSGSVVVGYISGAAVLIIANQLPQVLGLTADRVPIPGEAGELGRSFFSVLARTLSNLGNADLKSLFLGLLSVGIFFGLERKYRALPLFAITLVLVSGINFALTTGLPRINPELSWQVVTFDSYRLSDLMPAVPRFSEQGIFADVGQLFSVALAVAFLAALENSVMSKSLASRSGSHADVNQDMLSVGVANLGTAFLSGMAASGSLTRSALNYASGALTQMSSIISGLLCAIGALTLGPLIQYVPKCCLGALVICIAVSLINRRLIRMALMSTKSDAVVLIVTFMAALLMPLNVAIFLGVGTSVVLFLRKASQPFLVEYEVTEQGDLREAEVRQNPLISIVHVEGELFFGAAELFRTQIQRTCNDPSLRVIILRMKNARHLDATSVMALEELIDFLRAKGRHLIISGATKEVYRVVRNSGLLETLGRDNFFMYTPKNPNISTRNALKRAQELLGTEKAEVKIYYDPSHAAKD